MFVTTTMFINCSKLNSSQSEQQASYSSQNETVLISDQGVVNQLNSGSFEPNSNQVPSAINQPDLCEGKSVKIIDVTTESIFSINASQRSELYLMGSEVIAYRVKTPSVKPGTGKQWSFSSATQRKADGDLNPDYFVSISTKLCDFSKTLKSEVIKFNDLKSNFQYVSTRSSANFLIRQNASIEDRIFNNNTLVPDQYYYVQFRPGNSSRDSLIYYYSFLYGLFETPVHDDGEIRTN